MSRRLPAHWGAGCAELCMFCEAGRRRRGDRGVTEIPVPAAANRSAASCQKSALESRARVKARRKCGGRGSNYAWHCGGRQRTGERRKVGYGGYQGQYAPGSRRARRRPGPGDWIGYWLKMRPKRTIETCDPGFSLVENSVNARSQRVGRDAPDLPSTWTPGSSN